MATLTLQDVEKTAKRNRPWAFRMEYTDFSTGITEYWYATGRDFSEDLEIGSGVLGNPPQLSLVSWDSLQKDVDKKQADGYVYVDTPFIRMSATNYFALRNKKKQVTPQTLNRANPFLTVFTVQALHPTKDGFEALDSNGNVIQKLSMAEGKKMIQDDGIPIKWVK